MIEIIVMVVPKELVIGALWLVGAGKVGEEIHRRICHPGAKQKWDGWNQ